MSETSSPESTELHSQKVYLIEGNTEPIVGTRFEIRNEKDEKIGDCAIDFQNIKKGKYVSFTGVGIDDAFSHKGYGKLAYEEMAKLVASKGYTLRSAQLEWPMGRKVWNSLERKGLAEAGREGIFRRKFHTFKDT